MTLYLALLRVQARLMGGVLVGVALAVLVGFATPWLMEVIANGTPGALPARTFLRRGPFAGGVLLITAIVLGATSGFQWAEEGSRNKGVYLMCLPLERWHLLLLEFAVAVTFVLGGTLLTYAVGVATSAVAPIPEGLHAYPGALAMRFLSMALVVLAVFFGPSRAAANADPRHARSWLVAVLLLIVGAIVGEVLGANVIGRVAAFLFNPGGPLHFLLGTWMLVDL